MRFNIAASGSGECAQYLLPKAGTHGGEHLALALALRGVDDWTRRYFDETWVSREMSKLAQEIESTSETLVLSSERLAALPATEFGRLRDTFPNCEIHIIIVFRDLQRYLSSTWRHAVFRHDYGEEFLVFLERFKNFSFGDAELKFAKEFPVHAFNMDVPDYEASVGSLVGTTIRITHENVGVPMEYAQLLQKVHSLLGTREFQKRFDPATKKRMLEVWNGTVSVEIDPISAPLF